MIMNKKLVFAAMSLAAFTACTDNDFESKNVAQQEASPVVFEVLNNNDAFTRASMNGNTISWSATAGDLFTLYHGGALGGAPSPLSGYDNATYTASAGEGSATLTSPTMIKPGRAIMVWPADTTFYVAASGNLTVKIPAKLENIENNIPYVSDLITIKNYAAYSETTPAPPAVPTAYNTAGKDRKYAVYMRPMASQLILKADYAGTDATINALTTGDDPINPIALTSIDISDPSTSLTQEIDLSFNLPAAGQGANWATVENNAWTEVTAFDLSSAVKVNKLTTKCIDGIESAKFLILPQAAIGFGGLAGAGIVINTIYGKVATTAYNATEIADAWYRYMAPGTTVTYGETETTTTGTGSDASKVRYTQNVEKGLAQVIDAFSANTTKKATSVVVNEPTGAVGTRYVKVLLNKLDMDGLHITSDKQLYDAVRVWKEIGTGNVTVRLDGDATTGEFEISQKTIAKINEINAALAEGTPRKFNVTACNDAGETCNTIVITGGGAVQNMDFIVNTVAAADVALKAGETWEWAASETAAKTLTLSPVASNGVKSIINKGTFVSGATATLAIYDNATPTPVQMNVPFVNDGTWNVNAGDVTVQFDVTNNNIVNIKKGAEYHQDLTSGTTATTFINDAQTLPERFVLNDPSIPAATKAAFVEKMGVVNNSGVFAVTGTTTVKGVINNYSLIEHADVDAKTYITANELAGSTYAGPWAAATNKLGRINLPFSNKDEDNISINAGLLTGFVSVTVSTGNGAPANKQLNAATVGEKVNYVIINSGVETITEMSAKIKYIEFNDAEKKEIAWQAGSSASPKTATYEGMIVLSPVNIKLYTNVVVNQSTYLAAKVYVGGGFTPANYSGYYGNTASNVTSMVITY